MPISKPGSAIRQGNRWAGGGSAQCVGLVASLNGRPVAGPGPVPVPVPVQKRNELVSYLHKNVAKYDAARDNAIYIGAVAEFVTFLSALM